MRMMQKTKVSQGKNQTTSADVQIRAKLDWLEVVVKSSRIRERMRSLYVCVYEDVGVGFNVYAETLIMRIKFLIVPLS